MMAAMDFNPTKEIRGLTIRSVVQFVILLSGGIWAYARISNTLDNTVQATNELKEVLKEQRQQNEVQYKILQNELREQDLRLIKLEAEMKLYTIKP